MVRMKAVLFDVDDTLYDQTEPFCRAYQEIFSQKQNIRLEKLFAASRKYSDEVFEKSRSGEITMEEMYIYRIKQAFADFGEEISDEEALRFQEHYAVFQKRIRMSEFMEDTLSFCKSKVRLGIITNGPAKHQWEKIYAIGADRWIPRESILVSGEVGAAKPGKKIFQLAAERMGLCPGEMCYVGDSFKNDVLGAKGAGLHAIWFNRRQAPCEDPAIPDETAETEKQLRGILEKVLCSLFS